jgi:transcriptional regulator of acetoin/glycerol metabolism
VVLDETLTAEIERDERVPCAPFLFVVLESARPHAGSARFALADLDEVAIGRGDGTAERRLAGDKRQLLLTFPDSRLSSAHATLVRRGADFELNDQGSKNGSYVNGLPQRSAILRDGDLIQLGSTFFTFRRLHAAAPWAGDLVETGRGDQPFGLATVLPALGERFQRFRQAAASELPISIVGETGTGKELMAKAAHALSKRKGPFVAINCGAVPAALIESELFGHKRGAFSGATEDRPGLLRASDGGTLFLDEVVELPPAAQIALLRALQEREVRPIGDVRSVPVDLRVVCASHRELGQAVDAGRFRADLLARLSGFTIQLPPLRERREDFGLIVASLLQRLAHGQGAQLGGAAARRLLSDQWSMNIRALEKCLAAALVIADGPIQLEHLALSGLLSDRAAPPRREPTAAEPARPLSEEDRERRELLVRLLEQHQGNISAIARELGKERAQIRRWLRRYNLS